MQAKTVLEMMYQDFNKSDKDLKNNVFNRKPYIGISYPNLKLIAKKIKQSDELEFLTSNDFSVYELEILQTYVIGNLKDFHTAIKHFKTFVPQAKEWSVVDALCQKFVLTKKYPNEVFELLKTYAKIDDEYIQRVVAVMILSHFLMDDFIEQSIALLDQLKHQGYFCKMAVAWAFATIMAKYPARCKTYMESNQLDVWTHNKAIQKMLESYRISDADKSYLKQLKKLK